MGKYDRLNANPQINMYPHLYYHLVLSCTKLRRIFGSDMVQAMSHSLDPCPPPIPIMRSCPPFPCPPLYSCGASLAPTWFRLWTGRTWPRRLRGGGRPTPYAACPAAGNR